MKNWVFLNNIILANPPISVKTPALDNFSSLTTCEPSTSNNSKLEIEEYHQEEEKGNSE